MIWAAVNIYKPRKMIFLSTFKYLSSIILIGFQRFISLTIFYARRHKTTVSFQIKRVLQKYTGYYSSFTHFCYYLEILDTPLWNVSISIGEVIKNITVFTSWVKQWWNCKRLLPIEWRLRHLVHISSVLSVFLHLCAWPAAWLWCALSCWLHIPPILF